MSDERAQEDAYTKYVEQGYSDEMNHQYSEYLSQEMEAEAKKRRQLEELEEA